MNTPAREIVVAFDGSPDSDTALAWAAKVGALRGEAVTALIVTGPVDAPHSHPSPEQWWHHLEDRAHTQLEHFGAPVGSVEQRAGSTVSTLVDAASSAAMLVVGTSGHGRVARAVLGSVSRTAARRAHSPVVVVRPVRHPDSRRVVVGVDGSEPSLRALEFAARHAALTHDVVAVVRAWKAGSVPVDKQGDVPSSMSADLLWEENILEDVVAKARAEHPEISIDSDFIATDPGRALVDASARADLVVVGTRGLTIVEEAVLGSVSQYVLRRAQCPVAVVH
jgi:nucleotide-binding universal stress UspA family protein